MNQEFRQGEPIAVKLAQFVSDLSYEDLPAKVIESTKPLVLDQLGCELTGSTMPWVEPVVKLVELTKGAKGESTVVSHGTRYAAPDVAFVNATFGQA